MKILIVYSSRTGNTKKLAEAIAAEFPGCTLAPVESAPPGEEFDLVLTGYWVYRGMPDLRARAYMEGLKNTVVGLFGTLGAWPHSPHAQKCRLGGEALLTDPPRGNVILGTFLSLGRVHSSGLSGSSRPASAHPMTRERRERLLEAEKHPDSDDCLQAREFFRNLLSAPGNRLCPDSACGCSFPETAED